MSTWRFHDCFQVEETYTKPDTSSLVMGDPPFNYLGFIDGHYCERKHLYDNGENTNDDKADSRSKWDFINVHNILDLAI